MSKTPRTDALFAQLGPVANPAAMAYFSLACELERQHAELRETLSAADDDIREHLQVARYNLTGKMHTGDQCPIPTPPLLIHAEGIAKSDRVRERNRAVLASTALPLKWDEMTPQQRNDALHAQF